MAIPRFDQVNLVVSDVNAVASFLRALGLPVEEMPPVWAPHHRALPTGGDGFDADLDSPQYARHWGGLPDGFSGAVVNLRLDERGEVDELFAQALEIGAKGIRSPYDAFWGARYALVEAPGPLFVGLMSTIDPARRSAPPDVADFS